MSDKVYVDDYGKIEECLSCNGKYFFCGLDSEEPLEVYKCDCGKVKYKSINDYEG